MIFIVLIFTAILLQAQSITESFSDVYEPLLLPFEDTPEVGYSNYLREFPDGTYRVWATSYVDNTVQYISYDQGSTWGLTPDSVSTLPPGHWTVSPMSGDILGARQETINGVKHYRVYRSVDGGKSSAIIFDSQDANFTGTHISRQYWANMGTDETPQWRFMVNLKVSGTRVLYSDDDGSTWFASNQITTPSYPGRWNHGAVNPTIVQYGDTLWALVRTAGPVMYNSYSYDFGETWTTPAEPSIFYSHNTLAEAVKLSDGRIVLFNLQTEGYEPYFTPDLTDAAEFSNRDVVHASISDDNGKTWHGFRELYLNVNRNLQTPYTSTIGSPLDRGVQQLAVIVKNDDKIFMEIGQHPVHYRMLAFDPEWLYETTRSDDFSNGLESWTTHKHLSSGGYHHNFRRIPGPGLVDHPDVTGKKVLHLQRPGSVPEALIHDSLINDGAVWNFPGGKAGYFKTLIRLNAGFKGASIILINRWINTGDFWKEDSAMYRLEIPESRQVGDRILQEDTWYEIALEWNGTENPSSDSCNLYINRELQGQPLSLKKPSGSGINYVRFRSNAMSTDLAGMYIESVHADISGDPYLIEVNTSDSNLESSQQWMVKKGLSLVFPLRGPGHFQAVVRIYDLDGKVVLQKVQRNEGYIEVDTAFLKSGMYIISLQEGSVNYTTKFVKGIER